MRLLWNLVSRSKKHSSSEDGALGMLWGGSGVTAAKASPADPCTRPGAACPGHTLLRPWPRLGPSPAPCRLPLPQDMPPTLGTRPPLPQDVPPTLGTRLPLPQDVPPTLGTCRLPPTSPLPWLPPWSSPLSVTCPGPASPASAWNTPQTSREASHASCPYAHQTLCQPCVSPATSSLRPCPTQPSPVSAV